VRKLGIFFVCFVAVSAFAQDYNHYIFNVGGGVGIPVGNTSNLANVNGNAVIGGGLNFAHAIGFTGEFMWHGLPPSDAVLNLLPTHSGSANLYSVTGNFIVRYGAHKKVGGYVIGGGGWYHRNWNVTQSALVPGTVCGPVYFWYGVTCVSGLVPANVVIHSGSSNGGGLNIGAGFTFGREGGGAKLYTEVRYHYAYFSHANTSVLPITFGIRW
jgi:hypothetical protein